MMKYSKLFELLIAFTKKEGKELLNFAQSGNHELIDKDLDVLEMLLSAMADTDGKKLDEDLIVQEITAHLFNEGDPVKDKKNWNYTKSKLTTVANQFIIALYLKKDSFAHHQILLEYYQQHQLEKNLNSLIKKVKSNFEEHEKDHDTAYRNYKLCEVILNQVEGQRIPKEELDDMDEALDDFYFENKLRMLVEKYNRHRIINTPKPDDFFVQWLDAENVPLRTVGGQLFFQLFLMMRASDEVAYYYEAKRLFELHEDTLSLNYKKSICEYLMNQCIIYAHSGRLEFTEEYIIHIKYLIEKDILSSALGLSISKYANTVYMALAAGDLDWIEAFVDQFSDLVRHEKIDSIKKLNRANILFHKEQYEEALALLTGYSFSETYFRITFDKLCIKLFFEEQMDSTLNSKLKAFQKYINRSTKLPVSRKAQNIRFIKAVRALSRNPAKEVEELSQDDFLMLDYLWLSKKRKGGKV